MLRTGHADPAWFSATFLAQVPASKIDEVIASLKSSLGEYRSVEITPAKFVAFKGGSDVGVINLTTMVTTRRGTKICFSATLNDGEHQVDESAFSIAYAGVMHYLADG